MPRNIGRIVFVVSIFLFVGFVEIGWLFARLVKISQGMTQIEFAKWEVANFSYWEIPLVAFVVIAFAWVADTIFFNRRGFNYLFKRDLA